ncbi:MAG: hypothetical protein QOC82_2095 [Frankiaceae bacterium]|nr:hypothetical protein [Frankiaceae bacterium]
MVDAEYFDRWYADIERSSARQAVVTTYLGLPPEVGPSNLVPLAGLREIAQRLGLRRDGLLVDLACGRGGPGMWVARECGARIAGVDFSVEAVRQATARRALFGLDERATFSVGELTASGLGDGVADGVLCIDAVQFASPTDAATAEMRRLLRPEGVAVLTGWEPLSPDDPEVPERLRHLDLGAALTAAGFADVMVEVRPSWRAIERSLWEHALTLPADGDPAIESMHAEAERVLPTFDRFRRVLAIARSFA